MQFISCLRQRGATRRQLGVAWKQHAASDPGQRSLLRDPLARRSGSFQRFRNRGRQRRSLATRARRGERMSVVSSVAQLRNPLRRSCLTLVTSSSHLPRVGMPSLLKRAGAPPGGLRRATDCQNQRGPPTHRWMVRLVRKRRGKVFGGDSLSDFERWWSRQCSSQRRRRAPVRRRRVLDAGEMSGRQRRSGTGRRCRGRTL